MDLTLLLSMGSIGVMYFLFRLIGKYFGAFTGAYLAGAPDIIVKILGFVYFHKRVLQLDWLLRQRLNSQN